MKLLLSWSQNRSKLVASAFHKWLPSVVPGICPWISTKDISKGREWFRELQKALDDARICIIFLTSENVRSPWIYYETGAIAAKGDVLICPYLIGISPTMISDGPLGQWQCTVATRDDTWELIKSLNENALESKHDINLLEGNFCSRWPELEEQLYPLLAVEHEDPEGFIVTDVDNLAGANLSSEARTMVLETSKDKDGLLFLTSSFDGKTFQTNHKNLCSDQSPRSVAKWEEALDSLIAHGILKQQGNNGQFSLTAAGFDIADILSHS